MLNWLKRDFSINSPVQGSLIKLRDVNDSTFSEGLIGKGIGIYPSNGKVFSPISGEITMVFPTKHAIGLKRKDGLEILIHIGIDTVNLEGEGFTVHVNSDQSIEKGEKLVDFDIEFLKSNNIDPTVIIVVTNWNDYELSVYDEIGSLSLEDVIMDAK